MGSGGQGKVFLVRSPESARKRNDHKRQLEYAIRVIATGTTTEEMKDEAMANLLSAIVAYAAQDNPADFGALKLFDITGNGPEAQKAMGRLESEVKALSEISHPSILKLLYADVGSRRMITEYHPKGTLTVNRNRFRGNVGATLEAFRPLVDAVAILHAREPKIIHRDIKPENIFVASDGRLVLGDFGIVFFRDESKERLTSTIGEKVGTADWMAPWANVRERRDEVNPTFDIFPLGKVLWWMIAGKPSLPFWYQRRPGYDLEILYARDPNMALVNGILDRCVAEEEKNCLSDAKSLLAMVVDTLETVSRGGQFLADGVYQPCRVCGKGRYIREENRANIGGPWADVSRCTTCGHIQLFAATPKR